MESNGFNEINLFSLCPPNKVATFAIKFMYSSHFIFGWYCAVYWIVAEMQKDSGFEGMQIWVCQSKGTCRQEFMERAAKVMPFSSHVF